MFDEAKYDEVVAAVSALAAAGGAAGLRHHFAGYFDELGLWMHFAPNTPDSVVVVCGNALIKHLNETLPRGNPYFGWCLSLERDGMTLDVLSPEDEVVSLGLVARVAK